MLRSHIDADRGSVGDLLAPTARSEPARSVTTAAQLRTPLTSRRATPSLERCLHRCATTSVRILLESRPGVQTVFLLRMFAATGIVAHPSLRLMDAVIGWGMLTVTIYVFNGVTDIATDDANRSSRPIASGQLTDRTALWACLPLATCGLGLCLCIGPGQAGLGLAMLVLGWAYSAGPSLKKAPFGFAAVIGGGAALTYTAGWLARGHATAGELALGVAVSTWVGLCCASKDFSDVEGDRLAGRRTWPVVFGARQAARLLSLLTMVGAGIFVLATTRMSLGMLPAVAVVAGSGALVISVLTTASATDRNARRRPYKAFMVTQYAVNVAIML